MRDVRPHGRALSAHPVRADAKPRSRTCVKQGAGWIVNIGSVTGIAPVRPYREYNKTSGDVIYASMKAALHRFTQGVAAELLDANIAVNCVGPSTAVRTPGASQLIPDTFPTEPVEYLAETVLAMCHRACSRAHRIGRVQPALSVVTELPVHSLDGATVLPPLATAGDGQPEHPASRNVTQSRYRPAHPCAQTGLLTIT